jgi:PAS domain S-box-containing protein
MEALLFLLRVLIVFLIVLFWLLQTHFPRMAFFRWWTAAWAVFGVHLACDLLARATGQEIFLVVLLLAGYVQSALMVIGAQQYDRPDQPSRALIRGGLAAVVAAAAFFYGWSMFVRPQWVEFTRNAPRRFILGLALAYCAWVCLRRWRISASRSALVNTCAFGLSSLNELSGSIHWAGEMLSPSQPTLAAFLLIVGSLSRLEIGLGLLWPMVVSIGMILLLLEEHRRAEAAELASITARQTLERNFAKALRASPDAITITRLADGRFVEVNDAFLRMSGYGRLEVMSATSPEINLWADRQAREAFVAALREHGTVQNVEVRLQRRDGEILTTLSSAELLELDGEPHLLAISKDITERKKGEEALRASEERFASAFRSSPDAMTITTREVGQFLEVNEGFMRLTGYCRDEAVGRTALELGVWAREGERVALLKDLDRFGFVRDRVMQIQHKSGRQIVGLWSAEPINLEGKRCLLSIVRDITEQKRAAEALARSEARFRDLFENANDMIFTIDLRGNFMSINKAGERITGYDRHEIIGLKIGRLLSHKEQGRVEDLIEYLLAGRGSAAIELDAVTKDGRKVLLELSGRAMIEDAVPVGIEGIARDVTERKQLEAQLRQSQKMEAIGQLAGGVAHDFNNILAVILGYGELLAAHLPSDSDRGREIREVSRAAERAASLTRQLLAFSRKQALQTRVFDVNAVVADMDRMLRRVIGEQIVLKTKLEAKAGWVRADPSQIEQVIMNLAVNARDAMPHGGVLTICTRNARLEGASLTPGMEAGKYVVLEVRDMGIGMDEATRSRIFEPFFTTKEPGRGTGLGLATVHGIVIQSGGHISVDSQPGFGTIFEVYLPEAQEESPPRSFGAPVRPEARGSETILLVEDEGALREIARQVLVQSGFAVLSAANGEEALEMAASHKGFIHLLVTDVVLPGIRGTELAKQLRMQWPGTKVIYMSGYTDSSLGQIESTACLLQKPFRPSDLTTKAREVLDEAASQTGQ